jgi:hypothetical protein
MSRFWHNLMLWWRGYRRVGPQHTPKILNMKNEEKKMPKFVVYGPNGTSTDITAEVEKSTSEADIKTAVLKGLKLKSKKKKK